MTEALMKARVTVADDHDRLVVEDDYQGDSDERCVAFTWHHRTSLVDELQAKGVLQMYREDARAFALAILRLLRDGED